MQHLAQSPNYILEFTYLVASILFIFGLKGLSHPDTARRGMFLAEGGMAAAIIGTLFHHDIHFYGWIIAGLILGSLVGAAFAIWVPMTAMPQRTALSHAFGAIAASLVGIAEFLMHGEHDVAVHTQRAGPGSDARLADDHRLANRLRQVAGRDPRNPGAVQGAAVS